tara:strand:- start:92 stop:562 length:471 start_codon:yes stop_codon:yes gene_type:complete
MTDQEPKNELVDMIMNERFVAAEELIRESLQTKIHESLIQRKEVVAESLAANIEEEKQDYESFFKSAMKKFGISSPADLKTDEEKKKFFDYVDKNFKGMKESHVNEGSYGMMRRGRVEGEMPQMDPRMMQQMMMMMQQQGGMGGMPPMMNPQKKKI